MPSGGLTRGKQDYCFQISKLCSPVEGIQTMEDPSFGCLRPYPFAPINGSRHE